jgi:hypothetical protein
MLRYSVLILIEQSYGPSALIHLAVKLSDIDPASVKIDSAEDYPSFERATRYSSTRRRTTSSASSFTTVEQRTMIRPSGLTSLEGACLGRCGYIQSNERQVERV